MNDNIRSYFKHHATVDEFHFTADGCAFFLYDDAYNHAQHIGEETILSVTREEVEADLAAEEERHTNKKPNKK